MERQAPLTEEIKAAGLELRAACGSRRKVVELIGCSATTAQNWEKQGRVPEGIYLARISRAFPDIGARMIAAIAPDFTAQQRADDESAATAGSVEATDRALDALEEEFPGASAAPPECDRRTGGGDRRQLGRP